jgi:hypothetical protein
MPNTKISALTSGAPRQNADALPIARAGNNFRLAVSDLISFTPAGTGAVVSDFQTKLRESVSVKDFGAVGDGVTNDYAAIVLANTACAASGKALFFPSGTYFTGTSGSLTMSTGVKWFGENRANTYIKTGSATNDIVTMSGTYSQIDGISFNSSVTRSGGSAINLTGGAARVTNSIISGMRNGITLGAAASNVFLEDIQIDTPIATTGIGIQINGGTAISMLRVYCIGINGSPHFAGLSVANCGDITMLDCQFIYGAQCGYIAPGSGQSVVSIKSTATWYDQGTTYCIVIAPTGTGFVGRCSFNDGWASGGGGITPAVGISMAASGSAVIDNVSINDMDVYGCVFGISCDGVGIKNLMISGNKIAGNSSIGLNLNNITLGALVTGNRIGTAGGFGVNGIGVAITGTSNFISVIGNDLRLNTTVLTNSASGTGNRVEQNFGYNPVGAFSITVTASPFTYTAGASPETIYINAGTVSLIAVSGTSVLQSTDKTVQLSPNQTVTVTYTVAPSMIRYIH